MPEHQPKISPRESIAHHHEIPAPDDTEAEITIEETGKDDDGELEITIDSGPNDTDDDMEITIERPENIIELEESELEEVRAIGKPPSLDNVVTEMRVNNSSMRDTVVRIPETEKDPLTEAEIKKNQVLKDLLENAPEEWRDSIPYILRGAGFSNAELRAIKTDADFGNLLAKIEYESARDIFFTPPHIAPDDATFITNAGQVPHYRENLTLNGKKDAIIKRTPRDNDAYIKALAKEHPEKAVALKKFIQQKDSIKTINMILNKKELKKQLGKAG